MKSPAVGGASPPTQSKVTTANVPAGWSVVPAKATVSVSSKLPLVGASTTWTNLPRVCP
jgi:hypothetical protein